MAERNLGFTMIEMMVVLAVAAVLMAIALPSFRDYFDKAQVRGAADRAVTLIVDARGESVKRDRDVNISFGGTATAWCVGANGGAEAATVGDAIPAAVACDCTTAGACMVGDREMVAKSSEYKDVSASALPAAFVFSSQFGTVAPLATTSLTLSSPTGKYQLTLVTSALGQTSACVPAGRPFISGYRPC